MSPPDVKLASMLAVLYEKTGNLAAARVQYDLAHKLDKNTADMVYGEVRKLVGK
jgi:Flp pilus assembly protein TadD